MERKPRSFEEFIDQVDNLLRFSARFEHTHPAQEAGVWRLLCRIYRSGLPGMHIMHLFGEHLRQWLDTTSGDYLATLSGVRFEAIL